MSGFVSDEWIERPSSLKASNASIRFDLSDNWCLLARARSEENDFSAIVSAIHRIRKPTGKKGKALNIQELIEEDQPEIVMEVFIFQSVAKIELFWRSGQSSVP